jgi:phosphate/sulfate permease
LEQPALLKWEAKRKMGKAKYVFWYGAIGFGLSIVVVLTLIEWATEKKINASWVFIRILVFPIIGSLISNVRWANQENRFEQHQQMLKQ